MFNLGGQDILMFLFGAAVAVIAYFGKRLIEGRPHLDRLERRGKALALHKDMKTEGLTVDDLDTLETDLTARRRKKLQRIEDNVNAELKEQSLRPGPGETQAEMNVLTQADLHVSRAMLTKELLSLETHAGPDHWDGLVNVQKQWEEYAEAEARWVASWHEGGSIYPLVYLAELNRLTVSRIAEVRLQTDWMKNM